MRIEIAKHAGYCYGVERALTLAKTAALSRTTPIRTLGPIIHNPQVVDSLVEMGVTPVETINEVGEGTVIIRTHGVDPQVIVDARRRGLKVVDATCPFVAKAQRRAAALKQEGYAVVIVGERNHPEVEGVLAYVNGNALVVEKASDISNLKEKRVGVVVQTTQSIENLRKIVLQLLARSIDIKVYNTICNATSQRQVAARELANRADAMVVVGGKNSANTTRLAQICREKNGRTFHIETADELVVEWFEHCNLVGLTAGASTPDWILKEVEERLASQ
ncbi:MAG: 4-hydroxy-3-methylbut-2-enyl diphosphate reductase [Actinobacteria bacterium]|nr:4-hydroxy-3-methylbut-2-enyl diphosphate reductase [Actinomycetota bacterium]